MNDICVPIPRLGVEKTAKVEVTIADKIQKFNYRVESFAWVPDTDLAEDAAQGNRIASLRNNINNYDRNWELVQIYSPGPKDQFIQILFRERRTN